VGPEDDAYGIEEDVGNVLVSAGMELVFLPVAAVL